MIDLGSKIEIIELLVWMDGGSITLKCINFLSQEFEIEFVQNISWDWCESQNIPGRIYLNQKLVDQRSDLETDIIKAIGSSIYKAKDTNDQTMLDEKLEYVKSDKYLVDQTKVKKVKGT